MSVWYLKNIYAPDLVLSLDVTTRDRTAWGKLRSKFVNQIANRLVYITTCMHEKFANVNGRGGGTLSFENRARTKPTSRVGRACKNALCYVRISYELQRFRTRGYYRCNLNNIIVAWWWCRFRNEWESCFFLTIQKLLAKTMCSYVVKGIHTAHTSCIQYRCNSIDKSALGIYIAFCFRNPKHYFIYVRLVPRYDDCI